MRVRGAPGRSLLLATPTVVLLGLAGCDRHRPEAKRVGPGVLEVDTAPGVRLEVLDWGGTGAPLVFLAGGGHTAHQFDEFAPRLSDEFRVLGVTRRGMGASARSAPGARGDAVSDIAGVVEALELESVVLVGHSRGGHDAAAFAAAHPGRCRGIVYLDAAYPPPDEELAEILRTTPPPAGPAMTRADSASVAAVQAWIARTQGFRLPRSEILALNHFDAAGRLVGRAPSEVGGGVDVPELDAVPCAGLGLFPVTAPLETWLPHYASRFETLSADERRRGAAYVSAFAAWTARHREAFRRSPRNEAVEFPASGHYFFLEQPEQDRALAEIRTFVRSLPTGTSPSAPGSDRGR